MRYKVIKNYVALVNPISIREGEILNFVRETDPNGDWAGWVLCQGNNKEHNKEGWVPKQLIEIKDNKVVSRGNYTAIEHNLQVNEILVAQQELNGWIWCTKETELDVFAWAPLNHLQKI